MTDWLHTFTRRHLKLIFVLCCIGSSAIFFDGDNIPVPRPVLGVIGIGLGLGIELAYWMFSTDLTKAITKKDLGAIVSSLLFTLLGMGASWFLFTNAALVLGWAPKTAILPDIDRTKWAVIIGGVVSGLVLAMSLRREHPKDETDITAIAYSVARVAPYASNEEKLRLMGELATASSRYSRPPEERVKQRIVEALPAVQPQETHRASLQKVARVPPSQPAPSLAAPLPQARRQGLWSRARNFFKVQEVPGGQAALPVPEKDAEGTPAQRRAAPLRPDQPQVRPTGEQVDYPPSDDLEADTRPLEALLAENLPDPSSGTEWPAEDTPYPPFPAVRTPVGGRGNHQTPVQGVYHVLEGPGHPPESERADGSSFP